MKEDRITIRVTPEDKKEIELLADKHKMNISRFIYSTIKEKMEIDKLMIVKNNLCNSSILLLKKVLMHFLNN